MLDLILYHDQITSQYMKNIEEKLQQYRKSLEVIANNTVILSTLTDETLNPYDKGELVSKEVNNSLLLEKQSEVRNCMIYSSVQDCKIYGRRASMMQRAEKYGICRRGRWKMTGFRILP